MWKTTFLQRRYTNTKQKRCSTPRAIRKMQSKTIMRHHFIPTGMAIRSQTITDVGEDAEKPNIYPAGRKIKMVQPFFKTVRQLLKKLNVELAVDPGILVLGIYPKELKTCPHNNLQRNVHQWHYSEQPKRWKPKYPSTGKRMNKLWCIYIYNGTPFSHKKRMKCWYITICMNLG